MASSTERGDTSDAQAMTAMLTGYVFAGLMGLKQPMEWRPMEWRQCDTDGTIAYTLVSGMTVTISITVSPKSE